MHKQVFLFIASITTDASKQRIQSQEGESDLLCFQFEAFRIEQRLINSSLCPGTVGKLAVYLDVICEAVLTTHLKI